MAKDFIRDANPKPLYAAGLRVELPEYIKEYSMPTMEEIEKLASAAFADGTRKLHPIHTKEAAVLSGIYLHGTGQDNTQAMENVKRAASVFGVSEDLERILKALDAEQEKRAAAPEAEKCAISVEMEDGSVKHIYPIGNEVKLTKSARMLHQDFMEGKIPATWAVSAAQAIVKEAGVLGVTMNQIPERVQVLGTERLPNFDTAVKLAAMRKYDGVPEDAVDIYVEIAKSASQDHENLQSYIQLWEDMDITHGLSYKETFTPHEAVFTGMPVSEVEKLASDVVVIKGVMVPKYVVASLSDDKIDGNFREEIADVVKSAVKCASTNTSIASLYIDQLDDENKDMLLNTLL